MLLPNPEFRNWLENAINDAKVSIVIVNYLATINENAPHDPVAKIVGSLKRASRRGVKVSAILEGSKFKENYPFYRALKDGGADVWMDTSLTFIHTKAVCIDNKKLCIGSHNLSGPALTSHEEMSLTTDDQDAIAQFNAELERMTVQRTELKENSCKTGTTLPMSIMDDALIPIKRASAPNAYLIYLLLCRLDGGKPKPIEIDAESWASELGLPSSSASAAVRILETLSFMERKLKVVKVNKSRTSVTRI